MEKLKTFPNHQPGIFGASSEYSHPILRQDECSYSISEGLGTLQSSKPKGQAV